MTEYPLYSPHEAAFDVPAEIAREGLQANVEGTP